MGLWPFVLNKYLSIYILVKKKKIYNGLGSPSLADPKKYRKIRMKIVALLTVDEMFSLH